MKNKKFWLWIAAINILGVVGYKSLTALGAGNAYDKIVDELDSDNTIMFTKDSGDVVMVKKVNPDDENKE